jgi:hypothetical protein
VLVMYGAGIAFGLLALLLSRLSLTGAYIAGAGALAAIAVGVLLLESAPFERQQKKPSPAASQS